MRQSKYLFSPVFIIKKRLKLITYYIAHAKCNKKRNVYVHLDSCLLTCYQKMLLNLCASNQNTCFVVRCRVGGGVNSCGKLEKYSNNNVDTVFGRQTPYSPLSQRKLSLLTCFWEYNGFPNISFILTLTSTSTPSITTSHKNDNDHAAPL